MAFRDQMLVCESCGRSFVFTVTEQRRLAQEMDSDEVSPPALCRSCRPGATPAAATHEESAPRQRPTRIETEPAAEPREPEKPVPPPPPTIPAEPSTTIADEFPLEEDGIQVKLIGSVKWFSLSKGYGFVTMADGQDLFFHRSDVAGRQSTQIDEGQQVEFQVRRTDKGLEAFNVSILPLE